MSIPFKDRPKSAFQRLLDLVIQVSDTVAEGYKMLQPPLEGTGVPDPSLMLAVLFGLIDRCWKMDTLLQNFYSTLELETLGPIYWPELSSEIGEVDAGTDLGKVFPVSFKFLDVGMAHICLIYCTCSLFHSKWDVDCNSNEYQESIWLVTHVLNPPAPQNKC